MHITSMIGGVSMTIYGYGRPNIATYNRCDPAGLGIPFSPFAPSCSPTIPDSFESHSKKTMHKEEKKGFTFGRAVSSFFQGVTEPFVEMLKHPIKTLGIAAGLGAVIKKVPVVGKYVALAGLVVGGLQFLTGFGKAVTGLTSKQDTVADEGFKSMGTGTVSTVLSALGLKSAKTQIANMNKNVPTGNNVKIPKGKTPKGTSGKIKPNATKGTTEGTVWTKIRNFFTGEDSANSTTSTPKSKPNTPKTKTGKTSTPKGKVAQNSNAPNNQIDFDALLKKTASETPGYIAKGLPVQVPFVTYLNKTTEPGMQEQEYNSNEPLPLRMADDVKRDLENPE